MGRRALGVIALAAVLAAQAAGCGGDEEPVPSAAPAKPELTVPGEQTRSGERERASTSRSEPSSTSTSEDAPSSSTAPAPTTTQPPVDSPSNDTPPPAGSAADRFEKACRENPATCR